MEAVIWGNGAKKIFLADLPALPRFIRFNDVCLFYGNDRLRFLSLKYKPIQFVSTEEKCHSIENYLQPFKKVLNDSKSVQFHGDIGRNDDKFSNFFTQSSLLKYLSQKLLSIFSTSHRYVFDISFYCGEGDATNVLDSILQMQQIRRCSNLDIELKQIEYQHIQQEQPYLDSELPVEAISNWLNRKIDVGMGVIGRTPRKMRIFLHKIQNAVEMCENLTEVYYIVVLFIIFKLFYLFIGVK